MDTQVLEKIGLTKGEIKFYLAMLKLKECTITPLVKDSKVSKSKVYDILNKLIDKGLAGYIIKGKKRIFRASDPIKIVDYLEEKEKEFQKEKKDLKAILPALREKQSEMLREKKAIIYEGISGYETIREDLLSELQKGNELLVIGAPVLANIKYDERLFQFHIKREKKGIGMKIIYNINAEKFAKRRKQLKLTKVRFMPGNTITPSWIEIFKNSILIGVISEDYLICFCIKDEKVRDSFKEYFDLLWKITKK